MDKDRRAPLGGVDKETYVHSAENAVLNAELTYNLLSGLKSDVCSEIKHVKEDLKECKLHGGCQFADCQHMFIKKVHPRIPLSMPELIFFILTLGTLVGLGYITLKDVLGIKIPL